MLKMSEDVCLTKTIKNQMKNQEELNFLDDKSAVCLQIRFLAVDSYLLKIQKCNSRPDICLE